MKINRFLLVIFLLIPFIIFSKNHKPKPEFAPALGIQVGHFFPLGSYQDTIQSGWSFFLKWQVNPHILTGLTTQIELGNINLKSKMNNNYYNFIPMGLILNYEFPLLFDGFSFTSSAGAGFYFLSTAEKNSIINFYAKAGAGFAYQLADNLKSDLKTNFTYFNDNIKSIYAIGVATGIHYLYDTSIIQKQLAIDEIEIEKLFAAHYTKYYKNEIGTFVLKNKDKEDIEDVKVSFYIKNFMNKKVFSPQKLPILRPGKESKIPIHAYFDKNIKYLEANTQTTGFLEIQYKDKKGKQYTQTKEIETTIYNKNSMMWDDLNKLGSFITIEDKAIINYARKAINYAKKENIINESLINALKLFIALKYKQMKYVKDPKAGYNYFDENHPNADYIQYPRETLTTKTGDCDDFTVLYSALLESIGIKTAVIAVPGHIFMMFEADFIHNKTVDFQGKKWIPLETTVNSSGFIKMWNLGYEKYIGVEEKKVKTSLEATSEYLPYNFDNEIDLFKLNKDDINEIYKKIEKTLQQLRNVDLNITEIKTLNSEQMADKAAELAESGYLIEAVEILKLAINKNKSYNLAYYNLVLVYQMKNELENALKIAHSFLTIKPGDKTMKDLLKKLKR